MNRIFLAGLLSVVSAGILAAQTDSFTVSIDPPLHGKLQLNPPLPPDGKYAAGTIVTVTTAPDAGYVLDSAYYSVSGRFGQMYHEGMGRELKVTIDKNQRIGASFIEQSAVNHINVTHDVVYAKPGVKPLKYDVFRRRAQRICLASSSSTAVAGTPVTKTLCEVSRGN